MTNIHSAILEVVKALQPIQKNGELELGGRTIPFTRIDDIRDGLNPLLSEHGIVSYVDVDLIKHKLQVASDPLTLAQSYQVPILDAEGEPVTGSNGKPLQRTVIDPSYRPIGDGKVPVTRSWALAKVTFTFILAEDPSSAWTSSAIGEAYDTNGDKAFAKATTAAVKRVLIEVFKVTDKTEGDTEALDPENGNRSATTDRREGGDRGQQARAAAQGAQVTGSTRRGRPQATPAQPSDEAVEAADSRTGEVPDEPAPREESNLDKQKARVREAVKALKARDGSEAWTEVEINKIATELTGKATRPEWIVLQTAVKKLADALEKELERADG